MRTVVELGHQLGLHVVAEGAETADVVTALASIGCDTVQGFAFTRPLDADGVLAWIRERGADLRTRLAKI